MKGFWYAMHLEETQSSLVERERYGHINIIRYYKHQTSIQNHSQISNGPSPTTPFFPLEDCFVFDFECPLAGFVAKVRLSLASSSPGDPTFVGGESLNIRWMEEIPNNHLGMFSKPCKSWDKLLIYQLVQDFFHQQYSKRILRKSRNSGYLWYLISPFERMIMDDALRRDLPLAVW